MLVPKAQEGSQAQGEAGLTPAGERRIWEPEDHTSAVSLSETTLQHAGSGARL